MASIFFTERLPGISKWQSVDGSISREAQSGLILASGTTPEMFTIAANRDDPEPA
jgi:hypothetical protein